MKLNRVDVLNIGDGWLGGEECILACICVWTILKTRCDYIRYISSLVRHAVMHSQGV